MGKIPSILIRWLIALTLVAGLAGVVATPVSAQTITLSPDSGPVGTEVEVSGSGFAANSDVTITFDATQVATTTTDDDGNFTVTFTVPSATAGAHTVTATDAAGNSASATFTVESDVTISPTSGPVGTVVSVTGSGFAANTVITITFDGAEVTTAPPTVTTDANGAFTASFKVPSAKRGAHTVKATDGINVDTATFTVEGKVTVSPIKGPVGTSVTVTGTGHTAGVSVDIYWDNTKVASVSTDGKGSFTATFTVPTVSKGDYTIKAIDGAGYETEHPATFTVTEKISLSPTSGKPGTTVTIKGSQFTGGATVQLKIAGADWGASFTADADGTFKVTRTVPSISPGTKLVEAVVDTTTVATATFTVEALTINVSPAEGVPGTLISVTGSGFPANKPVDLTIGNKTWDDITTTDSAGSFATTVKYVDDAGLAPGVKTVKANVEGVIGSATFTLKARSITLSPNTGSRLTSFTVTGSGFRASSSVDVKFGTLVTKSTLTNVAGEFSLTLDVPSGADPGPNTIRAEDPAKPDEIYATGIFTVPSASVSVNPKSGAVGSSVTISGSDFTGLASLSELTIGGSSVLPAAGVKTDAFGKFSVTVNIPALTPGTYLVRAVDETGISATTLLTVLAQVTPAQAMEGIAEKLVRVWGWDAEAQEWRLYDPAAPEVSDLAKLEKGKGYWIKVTEDCTLIYGGNVYSLKKGWNLIGWLG